MQAIENFNLIWVVAGLAGLVLLGFVLILRHYHKTGQDLKIRLESAGQAVEDLRQQLHAAQMEIQRLQGAVDTERRLAADRERQFDHSRKQLKVEFENLANRILDDKTRAFDKTNRDSIESLLKPFREQVEGFQKRINEVHGESLKGNTKLEGEIRQVLEIGLKMSAEAQNLTEALKGDSQRRGSWGETQLEKTLQLSGLIEHDHYEKQTSMVDAEGRRKQTDFLIRLPDDKHIVIDSKVSLAAYDRLVAADSEEQQKIALAEHVRAVKRHIDDLAGKDYTSLAGIRSPSFVLMFMPIEPAYIEALKYEKDLFAYGYERNVVLVSHTTLIPILRTVANLWAMERSTREARELGDRAGDIYNQVRKVAQNFNKLGASLGAAFNHYNRTVTSLAGRQGLHGKIERFAQMSSKVTQAIPEVEALQTEVQHERLELLAEPLPGEPPVEAAADAARDPAPAPARERAKETVETT